MKETIDPENAMHTFGKYKRGSQIGKMEEWDYWLHGAHCGFKNKKTGRKIEVHLITSDGHRILGKMVVIGKFEQISLFTATDENIVVKDRGNV